MAEEFIYEDGRKAEKIEVDHGKTKVVEIYVEPKLEKKLAQRITEKYCVCEREIETIDENTGEVVHTSIEKVVNGESVSGENISHKKSPMEMLVEKKLSENKSKVNWVSVGLISAIVIQVLVIAYMVFA